jgi:subtilisin family serine protease
MKQARALAGLTAAVALVALAAAPAMAGKPGQAWGSTVDGYHTYDADMINVEQVTQDGDGVYVAVLDTGLVANWSDYFSKDRIATKYGIGFNQNVAFKATADPCRVEADVNGDVKTTSFVGSTSSSHGTHVTSTIIGYNYYSNSDAAQGFPLPAIQVRGIAPDVTIIPVKVLADYQLPKMPKCDDPAIEQGLKVNFGTDDMVAAGINYVTQLATGPLDGHRIVINMSLGGSELSTVEKDAIDNAIAHGVVIVAAAGNEGDAGMGFPGAYAPVISAGSVGWEDQWLDHPGDQDTLTAPANGFRYRMFWLQNVAGDGAGSAGTIGSVLKSNSGQVVDPSLAEDVFVSDFSSRSLNADQDLDVLAPGDWVRGPFGGDPGYNHLPWWSRGIADLVSNNSGNFYYVGGTSMATPHVSAVAALMLEKDDSLSASDIESLMESTALPIAAGSTQIWDPFLATPGWHTYTWGANATGSGLVQADAAIAAIP